MTRFDGPISGETISVFIADGHQITIPDSDLLFGAHFSRSGHDLVLTGDDGKSAVILDYFSQATPPALHSPDGATLLPHVVSALAGSMAPGQYAQAGDQQAAAGIGKVVTLEGSVTTQHTDGTVVQLAVGNPVALGDVLQTGSGASVGLVFSDGTVFNLSVRNSSPWGVGVAVNTPGAPGSAPGRKTRSMTLSSTESAPTAAP